MEMSREINDLPGLCMAVGRMEGLIQNITTDVAEIKAYIANDRTRNTAAEAAEAAIRQRETADSIRESGQQIQKESRRKRMAAWAIGIFGPLGVIARWLTEPHHPHQTVP